MSSNLKIFGSTILKRSVTSFDEQFRYYEIPDFI